MKEFYAIKTAKTVYRFSAWNEAHAKDILWEFEFGDFDPIANPMETTHHEQNIQISGGKF